MNFSIYSIYNSPAAPWNPARNAANPDIDAAVSYAYAKSHRSAVPSPQAAPEVCDNRDCHQSDDEHLDVINSLHWTPWTRQKRMQKNDDDHDENDDTNNGWIVRTMVRSQRSLWLVMRWNGRSKWSGTTVSAAVLPYCWVCRVLRV